MSKYAHHDALNEARLLIDSARARVRGTED